MATEPMETRAKADAIIKNTYRTLMTRGMKGCFVYFTDPATAAHFLARIAYRRQEPQAKPELRMVADKPKDQP